MNIYAIESSLDALARDAGVDPIEFRLSHLDDDRAHDVLLALRERTKTWPDPTEAGGRGIAYSQYKNAMTRVAVAVDLKVNDKAEVELRRAAITADAGRIVDAEGLRAPVGRRIRPGSQLGLV